MHSNENMSLRKTLSFHVVRWALATASPCSSQLDHRCKLRGSSWLLKASIPGKKLDFSAIPLQTRTGQNLMNRLRGVARRDLPFLVLPWAIKSLLPGCQSALCKILQDFQQFFSKIWKRYEISYLLEVFWAELFKNNVQETKTPAERAKILPKTDKNAASSDLEA